MSAKLEEEIDPTDSDSGSQPYMTGVITGLGPTEPDLRVALWLQDDREGNSPDLSGYVTRLGDESEYPDRASISLWRND